MFTAPFLVVMSHEKEVLDHIRKIVDQLVLENHPTPISVFEATSRKLRLPVPTSYSTPRPPSIPTCSGVDFNTVEDFAILKSAGIGLDDIKIFLIANGIKLLKEEHAGAKFWGKLITKGGGYYYIAVSGDGDIYCRTSRADAWIQLPSPTVENVRVCQLIQYVLTGDLKTVIYSHPLFNGTEMEYVSAVVKVLSDNCNITFDHPEGAQKMVPSVNCYPGIGLARFRHAESRRTLDKDERGTWTVEYFGDPNVYLNEVDLDGDVSHGSVLVKSNKWPGYSYVLSGTLKRGVQVYIGHGLMKEMLDAFFVLPPGEVQSDPLCSRNIKFNEIALNEEKPHAITGEVKSAVKNEKDSADNFT